MSSKSAEAKVYIDVKNRRVAAKIVKALNPETRVSAGSKAQVHVQSLGTKVSLDFKATDTTALRAAVNSYCRWVAAAAGVLRSLKTFERRRS